MCVLCVRVRPSPTKMEAFLALPDKLGVCSVQRMCVCVCVCVHASKCVYVDASECVSKSV